MGDDSEDLANLEAREMVYLAKLEERRMIWLGPKRRFYEQGILPRASPAYADSTVL